MRKSIINQAETAFAAYVAANILGTVLQGVNCYAAHTVMPLPLDAQGNPTGFANLTPPMITVTAANPEQLDFDSGIYELTVSLALEVQIDASQAIPGPGVFAGMMEQLRDMIENGTQIYEWLNSDDPINFQNFGLSALKFQDEKLTEPSEGRHLVMTVEYYVCATTNAS